jgi:ankyrin repeat protein
MINIATESDDNYYFNILVKISNLNVFDERGSSPLHNAIYINDSAKLFALLDNGANINIQDSKGQTPVYFLCSLNRLELAYQLIQRNADVNIHSSVGGSVALTIQEMEFPPTTQAYKYQQLIKQELVNQGIHFPVNRPWENSK